MTDLPDPSSSVATLRRLQHSGPTGQNGRITPALNKELFHARHEITGPHLKVPRQKAHCPRAVYWTPRCSSQEHLAVQVRTRNIPESQSRAKMALPTLPERKD